MPKGEKKRKRQNVRQRKKSLDNIFLNCIFTFIYFSTKKNSKLSDHHWFVVGEMCKREYRKNI